MECILFQNSMAQIQCKRRRLQRVEQIQGQYTSSLNYCLDSLLNFTSSFIEFLGFV